MLKLLPFHSPKRFVFEDPDTHYIYEARTESALCKHIGEYRKQNNLEPLEHLDIILQNYWCSLPENTGKCTNLKLERGLTQYIRGGIALVKNIFYGEKNMVSDTEADRRAEICLVCPYNSFPDKGVFLAWSDEVAEKITGGRRSRYHAQLGNCAVCSCVLKAKVFFKGPFKLSPNEKAQMSSVGCWQPTVNKNDQ